MRRLYYVYILASRKYGALYIGFTGDLAGRIYTHREDLIDGHTGRYHIHHLVHFEIFEDPEEAILREKRLKKWRRSWKIDLIEAENPAWRDLYDDIASSG